MSSRETRVDACVVGRYVEDCGQYLVKAVTFQAEALVFDNHWVELQNPTLSITYSGAAAPLRVEHVVGWLRIPVRKIERLTYDLCST